MKQYSFFAHFNRVNMQRGDSRVWTVHFRGVCYQTEVIEFHVPMTTKFDKDGRQPRATLRGKARQIFVEAHGKSIQIF
jgi:hypothetical protein